MKEIQEVNVYVLVALFILFYVYFALFYTLPKLQSAFFPLFALFYCRLGLMVCCCFFSFTLCQCFFFFHFGDGKLCIGDECMYFWLVVYFGLDFVILLCLYLFVWMIKNENLNDFFVFFCELKTK